MIKLQGDRTLELWAQAQTPFQKNNRCSILDFIESQSNVHQRKFYYNNILLLASRYVTPYNTIEEVTYTLHY